MSNGTTAIIFSIGVFIGSLIGAVIKQQMMEYDAISVNCAQYNPTTSDFEWLPKKDKE